MKGEKYALEEKRKKTIKEAIEEREKKKEQ